MGRRTIRRGGLFNSQTALNQLCVLGTGKTGAIHSLPESTREDPEKRMQ